MFFLVARKSWLIYLLPPVGKYQKTNIFYRAHTNRIDVQIVVSKPKYPEWLFFTILIIVIDTTRFRLFDLNTSQRKVPQNYRYTRSINYPNPHNSPTNTNEIHPDKHPSSRHFIFLSTKIIRPKKAPRVSTCSPISPNCLINALPLLRPLVPRGEKTKKKRKTHNQSPDTNYVRVCVCVVGACKKLRATFFSRSPKRSINATAAPLLLSSSSTSRARM